MELKMSGRAQNRVFALVAPTIFELIYFKPIFHKPKSTNFVVRSHHLLLCRIPSLSIYNMFRSGLK